MFATFFLLLTAALVTVVLAQSPQSSPRQEIPGRLEQNQQRQEELKARIATRAAQLNEQRIRRLKQVFTRVLDRFKAALGRLDRIVGKIERRIAKLNDRGVDTQAASAALEGCQGKKAAAQGAIDQAGPQIEAIDPTSTNVRETIKTSVEAMRSAKRAIRDYHKCLVEVTRILRAAKPKEGTRSAQ
ncbi:hypothetical protein HYW39_00375 [Candidatus Curtissbacteria bacterium]|nr:hypothetical protein [Candidatus Curtissbacteria bacterium]